MPKLSDFISRRKAKRDDNWKPLICIQGGGAKGAWKAGVLASLLESKTTSKPVAIWGTSAGALNAFGRSRLLAKEAGNGSGW